MEFVRGAKLNDPSGIAALGFTNEQVTDILNRTFYEQMFQHGFVHCGTHEYLSISLCFLFSVYALFAYASCLVQSGFVTILIVVYPTSPPESLAETVPARR